MQTIRILITSQHMIKNIQSYNDLFKKYNITYTYLDSIKSLPENEIIKFISNYDAWIMSYENINHKILYAGKCGILKIIIKWGIDYENIDLKLCKKLNIHFVNISELFSEELSDIIIGHLIILNNRISNNSLCKKKICILGFDDVGKCVVRKLSGFNMNIYVCDTNYEHLTTKTKILDKKSENVINNNYNIIITDLYNCIQNSDYIIITCNSDKFILNRDLLLLCNKNVKIIHFGYNEQLDQKTIIELLEQKHIESISFDIFNTNITEDNKLKIYKRNIFTSYNTINTKENINKINLFIIQKIIIYFNLMAKSNI